MSADGQLLLPEIAQFLLTQTADEHPVLQAVRQHAQTYRKGKNLSAKLAIDFLVWLARTTNAQHYLEIGVFTGYSSTAMALALPDGGTIDACDISITHTNHAKTAWQQAQIAHKITLHLQPALITLAALQEAGKVNHYDIILIDADKQPISHYLEATHTLLKKGGIIAIDNALLGKRLTQTDKNSPSIDAMRALLANLRQDPRFHTTLLPLGDGLCLLTKK